VLLAVQAALLFPLVQPSKRAKLYFGRFDTGVLRENTTVRVWRCNHVSARSTRILGKSVKAHRYIWYTSIDLTMLPTNSTIPVVRSMCPCGCFDFLVVHE
jgi:hypothetical protein